MKAEEIYRFLQPKPFQPVRVRLKDGQSYEIRFRELAIVGMTFLDIGIPEANETQPIYDSVVRVPVEDIIHLEHLANSTSSAHT